MRTEYAGIRHRILEVEPAVNAFRIRVYPLHFLHLMTSFVDVVLVDADGIYPYNLRSVAAAKGSQKAKKVTAHLEGFAIYDYRFSRLWRSPNIRPSDVFVFFARDGSGIQFASDP